MTASSLPGLFHKRKLLSAVIICFAYDKRVRKIKGYALCISKLMSIQIILLRSRSLTAGLDDST